MVRSGQATPAETGDVCTNGGAGEADGRALLITESTAFTSFAPCGVAQAIASRVGVVSTPCFPQNQWLTCIPGRAIGGANHLHTPQGCFG